MSQYFINLHVIIGWNLSESEEKQIVLLRSKLHLLQKRF